MKSQETAQPATFLGARPTEPRSGCRLSPDAARALELLRAWFHEPSSVSPEFLAPLFDTAPSEALDGALSELCREGYLRRKDGSHYDYRAAAAT